MYVYVLRYFFMIGFRSQSVLFVQYNGVTNQIFEIIKIDEIYNENEYSRSAGLSTEGLRTFE